ncbi:RHS repeat domain-containing protein, partial [Woodsholea maritima]|uniref:hypothetical protein n=1 Tax=Woodsholea maritima TaxID=240237 RepID=UPI0012EC0104
GTPPNVSSHSDDRITEFVYDKMGRRTEEKRLEVKATSGQIDDGKLDISYIGSTILYSYNSGGQIVSKTHATGDRQRFVYDDAGRMISESRASFINHLGQAVTPTLSYTYDVFGNLSETVYEGDRTSDRTMSRTYDNAGRVLEEVNALGHKRVYYYDEADRVVREEYQRTDTSGALHHEAIGYDYDLAGQLISQRQFNKSQGSFVISADSVKTHMRYNAFGEVIARGLETQDIEFFIYDNAGRLIRSNQGDGVWDIHMHDALGNQTLTVSSDGRQMSGLTREAAIDVFQQAGGLFAGFVDDMVATITVYDKRGQAVEVREPQRERAEGVRDNRTTYRTYNAFGEVAVETNAAGHAISYAYNTMGRLIYKTLPKVMATHYHGGKWEVTPVEEYYYDASGRLVAEHTGQDANTWTQYNYLAGTGYDGQQGLVITKKDRDGSVNSFTYNRFGEVVTSTDQVGRTTTHTYDKLGRLVQIQHPAGLVESFAYDEMGQRIKRWNNAGQGQGEAEAEETHYDIQGRVTKHKAFGGDITSSSYAFEAALTGGFGQTGGWVKVTTMANGKTLTEKTDIFERELERIDLGGHITTTHYDGAGRVVLKESDETDPQKGSDVQFTYYNTNRVKSSWTNVSTYFRAENAPDLNYNPGSANGAVQLSWNKKISNVELRSTYSYDIVGNQVSYDLIEKGIVDQGEAKWNTSQQKWVVTDTSKELSFTLTQARADYDALGRLSEWQELGGALPRASLVYEYDQRGNVMRSLATYHDLDNNGQIKGAAKTKDEWFTYDLMDRVLISGGVRDGSTIKVGTGFSVTYHQDGRRATVTQGRDGSQERYEYDAGGHLKTVHIRPEGGVERKRALYKYDLLGRMTQQMDYPAHTSDTPIYDRTVIYNAKSQITDDISHTRQDNKVNTSRASLYYGANGNEALGSVLRNTTRHEVDNQFQSTNTTSYEYDWYSNAVQKAITVSSSVSSRNGVTTQSYINVGGQAWLTKANVTGGRARHINYTLDMSGQVIARDENNHTSTGEPHERWYRFGDKQMGYIGNNGNTDFSYAQSIDERAKKAGDGDFRNGAKTGSSFADFDQGLSPINSYNQGSGGGVYTVQNGDTLQ